MDDDSVPSIREQPKLRSFRPQYVKDDHSLYVSLLASDLTGKDPSQNVALSGAYGSGKSSVLRGLLEQLDRQSVAAIQVSLATLNQSRASLLAVAGEPTLTAALEKEVVKRLLYSVKPKKIPRSRFNRIGAFRCGPAVGLSAVAGTLVVGTATTFGVELPLTQLADAKDWWQGAGLAADFAGTSALAFAVQRVMSSFRLSEIALGPATLSLDDKDGNYFDHYLDEIVYFFEQTKTKVVVFEDLDRFDDPGIFLALRELNNLLNNSDQVEQPVSFVYAIRDSLFVRAVQVAEPPPEKPAGSDSPMETSAARPASPDAHVKNGTELAASDRAKFFDLIVPIVPFISHEVAADLLLKTLSELPQRLMPTRALVTTAGRHFTDMRVIHSIRNEYEVFAAELLDKSAVKGLTRNQLFAMVLYKHLYLDDFERIRTGKSRLDTVVDRVRAWVSASVTALDEAIAAVEDAVESATAIDRRSAAAGTRLLNRVDAALRMFNQGAAQSIMPTGARAFSRDEVGKREFWEALVVADDQSLTVQSDHSGRVIAAADVANFLERDGNPKAWLRSELQSDRTKLRRLKDARTWVRTASVADLLGGPFPSVQLGADHSWSQLGAGCRPVFDDELIFELLRSGYLDQNFAIYTTKFHGAILSAEARSYLMQYVDRHRNDPLFELSDEDVQEIVSRLGDTFLADVSSLNVSVVDHLLKTGAPKLPAALEATGQVADFVSTYLANGAAADELLKRIAPVRADILDVVVASASASDAERRSHLDGCIAALSSDVAYTLSTETVEFIDTQLDTLPALAAPMDADVAVVVADLLAANGLKVTDLTRIADPMRSELATHGCFNVTRENLAAITGSAATVGLDTLGGLDNGVGRHLLSDLPAYLAAIRQESAGSIVDDGANLNTVVRAIVETDRDDLSMALAALKPGVVYEVLEEAPDEAYPELALADAFKLTRENVTRYVDVVGELDSALASSLERSREIAVAEANENDTDEEAARKKLAAAVLTSKSLTNDAKLKVVASLQTSTMLNVAALSLADPTLATGLLSAGEIADTAETFVALAGGPWPVFEACVAVSKTFGAFVAELPLADELMASVLLSPKVPDTAKRRLLAEFDARQPALAAKSAGAWMTASGQLGLVLTPAQVTALGQAGAPAKMVLDFLLRERTRLTAPDMVAVLAFCGTPYSSLGSANGATLTVPHSDDMRGVLQTLKSANIVKDFRKKTMREHFEVHMAV